LERGLATSGRTRADIWVFGYLMLVAGDTEEEQARAAHRIRGQVAFYGSSPMYRDVLDCIGSAGLQDDLHQLVKAGRWSEMPGLVDDEVLDHFVVRGTLEELPARIRARYGAYYDRAVPYLGLDAVDPDRLQQFVTAVSAP
jgi:Luciferase-like monooxygenase